MRRAFFVLGFLLSVAVLLGACAPTTTSTNPQLPPEAEMRYEQYPILPVKHIMLSEEVLKLGLRIGKLEKDTFVFNHYRALGPKGGWKDEVLPAGTGVAKDADGRAWFKLDCANRLFEPVPARCPVCKFIGWTPFGGGGRLPWWLPWLLLLPLLGLLGWLLGRRREEERQRREPEPRRPGNGGGNGHGRGDPLLDIPSRRGGSPADPTVVRRAALEREIAEQTAAAAAHEAKAAELRGQIDPAGDPDAGIALLGQIVAVDSAVKAARATAAAKRAELDALGSPPAPPAPAPQPAPTSAPPNDKTILLALLRTEADKADFRHRALRLAIESLEKDLMTPAEVRGWLQRLGVTL